VLISLVLIAAVSPTVKAKLESVFQKAEVSNAASASISTGNQTLEEGAVPASLLVGPRVGIDFAQSHDVKAPLRFAAADSRAVSRRRELTVLPRQS